MSDTYRRVKPSIAVDVEHEGRWYPGVLDAWYRRDDGWHGHVAVTLDVGTTYLWTVPADRLRKVD